MTSVLIARARYGVTMKYVKTRHSGGRLGEWNESTGTSVESIRNVLAGSLYGRGDGE